MKKHLVIIYFLVLNYIALTLSAVDNLDIWAKKVLSLKQFPISLNSLPNKTDYQKSILEFKDFIAAIEQVAQILKIQVQDKNNWTTQVDSQFLELFDITRPIFQNNIEKNFIFKPYAQRLIVKPESKIIFFGDLHGSAHTLIRSLLKLKDFGFLDANFKIKKKNSYILFLGDYTDRGIYGTEVLYTIMLLKIANPNSVFLVRGNHEDYKVAVKFSSEETIKEHIPGFLNELHRKFIFNKEQEIILFRLYDLLPVVIYLGVLNDSLINYIQCCHAGMEIGYNPYKLLNSIINRSTQNSPNITYELITKLNRKTNFYTKFSKYYKYIIKNSFSLARLCNEIQDFTPVAPFEILPNGVQKNFIGFLWNDFYTDKNKLIGPRGIHFLELPVTDPKVKHYSGWVFGKKITKNILAWANSSKASLKAIIRAHQHNNDTGGPMLNLLCKHKGLLDIWNDGTAYCLVSAPDSILTHNNFCFTYDSFVRLDTDANFRNWKIFHYWSKPYSCPNTWFKRTVVAR